MTQTFWIVWTSNFWSPHQETRAGRSSCLTIESMTWHPWPLFLQRILWKTTKRSLISSGAWRESSINSHNHGVLIRKMFRNLRESRAIRASFTRLTSAIMRCFTLYLLFITISWSKSLKAHGSSSWMSCIRSEIWISLLKFKGSLSEESLTRLFWMRKTINSHALYKRY